MGAIANALADLATFGGTVAGITHSYALSATPDNLAPSMLPCAVIDFGPDDAMQWEPLTFLGQAPAYHFEVTQLIMVDTADVHQYRKVMPTLITLLDAYLTALKGAPYLIPLVAGISPSIHKATVCIPKIATIPYGDVTYYGIVAKHKFEVFL